MGEAGLRKLLAAFQDGYANRDPEAIDRFMRLFDDSPELEVIGTNAVRMGEGEWSFGREPAKKLVLDDWKGWGDLELDLEGATARACGDVGWLSVYGVLSFSLAPEKGCEDFLRYAAKRAGDEGDARERLMDIIRLGSNTAYHAQRGADFSNPIRITAVAMKKDGEWRFAQMHFSFCTNDFPDVRL